MLLPIGKLEHSRERAPTNTPTQDLAVWHERFERAGCEVEKSLDLDGVPRLNVLLPGFEASFLPESDELVGQLQRWFRDRMLVSILKDGTARFRFEYFSQSQLLFHSIVSAFFVFEVWFGQNAIPRDPRRFAFLFIAGHLATALVALLGFRMSLANALGRVRER